MKCYQRINERKRKKSTGHVKRKQEANAEKAEDKKKAEQDHSYMSVNFDMEAVLYSPLLLGKPVFYKRKIACFNFTVFDTATKQGYCYKWPEYEGNRGANEVSTCLNLFLKQVPTHVSHVVLHSDCCPGQNRNSILLYMLMTLQSSNDCTIDVIDLKFLEPGHTHMECDNMHAAIERASESARIFIPDDWNNVIILAVKTKPYKLHLLTHENFIDFKSMKESAWPASIKATDGTGLTWKRVKWLRFRKDCPGRFYFKLEYSDDFKEVIKPRTRLSRQESTSLVKAYNSQIPLTGAKIKDLLEMCRSGLIPTTYHSFYNSLPRKPLTRVVPQSDDEDEDANLMASRSAYRRRNRRN
ncbi:unnamed protein product [Arctia plantaginis]|uniref:DUF7869 domain-containing protein n=1 Tax=Arctia plantaginis TaxID=874455 RepID=A0A8S1B853_ARCPL|nr:unnamed protein product [Arctia plantaginis]